MMLLVLRILLIKVVVAMRVKVMLRGMATLSQTRVNGKHVLNFHNDAYNLEANMYDFHYFCVFLVHKIKAYARIENWERKQ